MAKVGKADFNFITELCGFFLSLVNLNFNALGNLWFIRASPALRRLKKCAKGREDPIPVDTKEAGRAMAVFHFFNPFVGSRFMPIIRDRTDLDLNPELFPALGAEFSQSTGDAGEGVDLKVFEGLNRESFILCEDDFRGIDDRVCLPGFIDIIFFNAVNLDCGVLSINLALDKTLKNLWHPDIKADLTASRNDFKTKVFLNSAGAF